MPGSPVTASPAPPSPRLAAATFLFLGGVAIAPLLLSWHLHGQWVPDGAYAYGWIVPFLTVFLIKLRWDDRPAPSAPLSGMAFLAIICALLTLPARWLQEAAPERSVCAWTYALAGLGITLSLIGMTGGAAWLRWLAFPVLFLLTAVPWPHMMEVFVSNSLMHGTAGVTVEILCLAGVPAAQVGNLVHVESGVIDIDEACSGIRSLQAMVMFALFLGEMFRLVPGRRIALLALGLAATLGANIIRTAVLSYLGFTLGMGMVDRFHDLAGLAVLVASLSITIFAAYLLRPKTIAVLPVPAPARSSPLPLNLCSLLLGWFVLQEVAVEGWYRWHEPKWPGWSWSIQWPEQTKDFRRFEIPERSRRLLLCDDSQAARWTEADGSDWSVYWIRWNPGNPQAEVAKVHRPDVCLNSEGAIMDKDLGVHRIGVGGLELPFHCYTFRMGEKTLFVFFCLFEERPNHPVAISNPQFEEIDMFQRAREGRRHIGQQSLEIAITSTQSERSAQEAFTARLKQMMQVRPGVAPIASE
ncbi:MAG TPA: archaeosortase/exosortase family protein [Chthoniobacter sp.]|nr:archaeosortase/exosortase family protein [Chthoniobacter sp.]